MSHVHLGTNCTPSLNAQKKVTERIYEILCTIWYNLHNLKNVKKPMEEC